MPATPRSCRRPRRSCMRRHPPPIPSRFPPCSSVPSRWTPPGGSSPPDHCGTSSSVGRRFSMPGSCGSSPVLPRCSTWCRHRWPPASWTGSCALRCSTCWRKRRSCLPRATRSSGCARATRASCRTRARSSPPCSPRCCPTSSRPAGGAATGRCSGSVSDGWRWPTSSTPSPA
jgi:hypothetical protein